MSNDNVTYIHFDKDGKPTTLETRIIPESEVPEEIRNGKSTPEQMFATIERTQEVLRQMVRDQEARKLARLVAQRRHIIRIK